MHFKMENAFVEERKVIVKFISLVYETYGMKPGPWVSFLGFCNCRVVVQNIGALIVLISDDCCGPLTCAMSCETRK